MERTVDSSRSSIRQDAPWRRQLEGAGTSDDVVALMRDYIATITPEALIRLPERCQRLRVKAEDDIEYWTYTLSQHCCEPSPPPIDMELVRALFVRFLHASLRISEINKEWARRTSWALFAKGA